MSYTEKRNILQTEINQGNDAVEVISKLQELDSVSSNVKTKIDSIISSGAFNTIDSEIKAPAIAAISALNNLRTALSAVEIREMLDWRESK